MNQIGRRVVVTGMGLRSPIGNTLKDFSHSLTSEACGISAMPEWDSYKNLRCKVAALCHLGEDEINAIHRKHRRTMGRVALLAGLAAHDAVVASGLSEEQTASPRCGVSFGSTEGSISSQEGFLTKLFATNDFLGFQSSTYLQFMSHTCAANLATMFESKGPVMASCTACTSGSQGIGFGYEAIRFGRADIMITGGAEEMHFLNAGIFDIMRATSTRFNGQPEVTPKPFDAMRDGLVVGEGGGCLVLEEYDHALRRGAPILAEILGWATNCSGTHLTNADPAGIAAAMRLALADAQLPADRISHINAHATATETGDAAEAAGTYEVFGSGVPVSALKGYMGHTLGASGALESIATILMMREGFMAPSRNLVTPDPAFPPLDHVIGPARQERFSIAMNNNFAFGGINTSLIFGLV